MCTSYVQKSKSARAFLLAAKTARLVQFPDMGKRDLQERQRSHIRGICNRFRITPTELARKAGISPSTLTRFLNHKDVKNNLSAATIDLVGEAVNQMVKNSPQGGPQPDQASGGGEVMDDEELGILNDMADAYGERLLIRILRQRIAGRRKAAKRPA
jgi:transcriptional regulator with XRE-family HTH domain